MFCYRVKKYIGAYLAALNGADTIIFTGGIGENAPAIRAQICANLDGLGVSIDAAKNDPTIGKETNITGEGARTQVWVIPTNEELLIARDTLRCILDLPHP
jgi:acetate kinase